MHATNAVTSGVISGIKSTRQLWHKSEIAKLKARRSRPARIPPNGLDARSQLFPHLPPVPLEQY